jgi:putative flavoprotein involved in K+ transport
MRIERVETLIVGGGQAGLVMSHMLSRHACPHLVLERGSIAERWRSERWQGLRFQFPNWSVRLPDFPLEHRDPDGFASSDEILDFLNAYAALVQPPIRCGVTVTALRHDDKQTGFLAETSCGLLAASNVVIATGPYQRPVVPARLADEIGVFQVHASAYRAPEQLPDGAVLIVGSGASGAQIAEELLRAGRRVYLAVGRHKRMPRRYRGRDLIWWLSAMGLDRTPAEQRGPETTLPLITGAYGGHTIDFRDFARRGVTLLGRLQAVRDAVLYVAEDLAASLKFGDAAYHAFLDRVDRYIEQEHMPLPAEPESRLAIADPPCLRQPLRRLDYRAAGIGTVIWATGYAFDFGWINVPVLNAHGEPRHQLGVAPVAGLYFLGLPWLSKMNSSFLAGVADDAARLADQIRSRTPAAAIV